MFLRKNFGTVLADAAKFSGQIGFRFPGEDRFNRGLG